MAKIEKGARFISKISNSTGISPTIPLNNDHTTGWKDTDIYVGEWFFNVSDAKIYFRSEKGIHQIITTKSIGSDSGKINAELLPGNYMGAMIYKGIWDASNDEQPGANKPSYHTENGDYFIVSKSGTTNLTSLGGTIINEWNIGDFAIYTNNDSGWQKVDNSDPIILAENILYSYSALPNVSNTNVKNALDIIFNSKFLNPSFDKMLSLNDSTNTSCNTLLQLNGNRDCKWITFNGTNLNIGSYDDHSVIQLGSKGLTSVPTTSTVNFRYTDTTPTQYNRWSIYSDPSNGYLIGYDNNGLIENIKLSTNNNSFINNGLLIGDKNLNNLKGKFQVNTNDNESKLVISRSGVTVGINQPISVLSFYQNNNEYGNISLKSSDLSTQSKMVFNILSSGNTLTESLIINGSDNGTLININGDTIISKNLNISGKTYLKNTIYYNDINNKELLNVDNKMSFYWKDDNDFIIKGNNNSTEFIEIDSSTGNITLNSKIKTPNSGYTNIYAMDQNVTVESDVIFNSISSNTKFLYNDTGITFDTPYDIPHRKYVDDQVIAHAVGLWSTGFTNVGNDLDVVLSSSKTYWVGINKNNPTHNLEVVGNVKITDNLYLDSGITSNGDLIFTDSYNTGVTLSELSELTKTFTLDKTITKGKIVQLLDNGKIEDITLIGQNDPINVITSGLSFSDDNITYQNIKHIPNTNNYIISYDSNVNNVKVSHIRICSVINDKIEYGSLYESEIFYFKSEIIFLPNVNDKFILIHSTGDNTGIYLTICNIIGNNIIFNNNTIVNSVTNRYYKTNISFDPNNINKFILSYYDNDIIITEIKFYSISNNSINLVNTRSINNISTPYVSVEYLPSNSNNFLLVYSDSTKNGYIKIGTINNNIITYNNPIQISINNTNHVYSNVIFDPINNDNFYIGTYNNFYKFNINNNIITQGGIFSIGETNLITLSLSNSKIQLLYTSSLLLSLTLKIYDYLNSIFINNTNIINNNNQEITMLSFGCNNNKTGEFLVIYNKSILLGNTYTNMKISKIVGILQLDGIQNYKRPVRLLNGIDNNQNGLIINKSYYLQPDGSISTSSTGNTVYIGKSLTTNSIKINLNSEEILNSKLTSDLTNEMITRLSVDTSLSTSLKSEINSRIGGQTILNNALSTEINNRTIGDQSLSTSVLSLKSSLSTSIKSNNIVTTGLTVTSNFTTGYITTTGLTVHSGTTIHGAVVFDGTNNVSNDNSQQSYTLQIKQGGSFGQALYVEGNSYLQGTLRNIGTTSLQNLIVSDSVNFTDVYYDNLYPKITDTSIIDINNYGDNITINLTKNYNTWLVKKRYYYTGDSLIYTININVADNGRFEKSYLKLLLVNNNQSTIFTYKVNIINAPSSGIDVEMQGFVFVNNRQYSIEPLSTYYVCFTFTRISINRVLAFNDWTEKITNFTANSNEWYNNNNDNQLFITN